MDQDGTYTAEDLAAKFDVGVETVYRKCRTGQWPHFKIGRLYRFTPEQYQAITAPPAAEQKPRTQRQQIAHLLRSA